MHILYLHAQYLMVAFTFVDTRGGSDGAEIAVADDLKALKGPNYHQNTEYKLMMVLEVRNPAAGWNSVSLSWQRG